MRIIETKARQIITRSRLPDAEYVVNPYTGCEFGCLYCYASFMGRFVNEPIADWGGYVYVKTNAVELFKKEVGKLHGNPDIFLSSVTDPYQGVEARYRLTRGILQELADIDYGGPVGVQTKSSMVLRDLDVIGRIRDMEVGMTVTTTDDSLGRLLEVRATSSSMRLNTLKRLNEQGVRTYAFIGPLLPHFAKRPELLDRLFSGLADSGVRKVYVEHINMSPYIRARLLSSLSKLPELRKVYESADTSEHKAVLDRLVAENVRKYNMQLKFDSAIEHKSFKELVGK